MKTRLIVGCGYVGQRVARKWLRIGDSVFAFTRSQTRAQELLEAGIQPIVWDWLSGESPEPDSMWSLFEESMRESPVASILVAVSHAPFPGIPHLETHTRGLESLRVALEGMGHGALHVLDTKWTYLSTTGVYGSSEAGEWVDERSAIGPQRPGSLAAWEGEKWMSRFIPADRRIVLRPVGIYGPERVPRWQSIRDQVALEVDPDSYLNLIHVDDLASTIFASADRQMTHSLYCVSDGEPVQRRDYYEFISQLGNWPKPIFLPPASSSATKSVVSRSDGNKRIRSDRIHSELKIEYAYPNYREGLKALLPSA